MADCETMSLVDAIEYIRNDEAHAAALAELQEVREVLEGLQTFQMNLSSEGTERHWCQPNGGCNSWCQRAGKLMERLEVNGR